MRRVSLPARLALLSMLVVAVAVSAALYLAWRTTDARLTAEIDTDLSTQLREWDRLVTQRSPVDAASLTATAREWVREQQDHPARQLQAVRVGSTGGAGGTLVGNSAWRLVAGRSDAEPLLSPSGPRDVLLADGSTYRVVARAIPPPDAGDTGSAAQAARGPMGVVAVADSIDTIVAARSQLARDAAGIGLLAMGLAALLVGGGSALLTRQLRRLGQVAAAAGAGDLSVRAGPARGSPEVRDLTRVLDDSLDRIEATLAAQRAFVADASHELRTPLAVIRAQAELIAAQCQTGDAGAAGHGDADDGDADDGDAGRGGAGDAALRAEDVADLLRQTDATRRLVDDLLTIAVGDAAPASLVAPRDIDLRDHVEDLRRDLPLLGERRFVVRTVDGTLRADPDRLDAIVRNLVANAVAHTPRDGLIEVLFESHGPDRMRIVVRDDGSGMPPEVAAQAFDRFARGRGRTVGSGDGARVTGSAGLGLPLVRTLALAHGGTARLTSELGRGTTVVVDLPGYRPPIGTTG